MNVQAVHLAVIHTNGRVRKLSRPKVRELADSITEIGLLNPITVCSAGSEFTLVAGRHRLEAARLLEWQTIPATVVELSDADRHIAEIDENLIRNDLSDLERAEHLSARKGWYEAKHPETRRGGDRRSEAARSNGNDFVSFGADTSQKTGRSERAVQQDVQIAQSIPEDIRDAIRDTPLAESKTDLLAIARLPEEAQRAVIAEADLHDKTTIRQAVAAHRPMPPAVLEPEDEPSQERHYTEVETTVETFALAALSLFEPDECRRLITLICEGLR